MTQTTRPPKVGWAWILGLYVPLFGGVTWWAWAGLGAVVGLVTTAFALLLAVGMAPALTTVLDEDGVSQLTIRGRRRLLWKDVRRVRLANSGGVLLEGPREVQILISPIFFSDFDATQRWLASRLDHVSQLGPMD